MKKLGNVFILLPLITCNIYCSSNNNTDSFTSESIENGNKVIRYYTYKKELAKKQIIKNGWVYDEVIFWEEWPCDSFVFVSKKGYRTFKDGVHVQPDSTTPDGIIETIGEKIFVWKNGKRTPYTLGKHDNITEIIYEGPDKGEWGWKNGKRYLIRQLTDEDSIQRQQWQKRTEQLK